MTKLSKIQMLFLWALIVKDGSAFEKDTRPKIKAAERDKLASQGLITKEKRQRGAIWLEVTDAGYDFVGSNLDADLPERSPAGTVILQTLLSQLKAYIESNNISLADILMAPHEATPDDLRARIRAAYLETTGGEWNRRALLADVRKHLQGFEREKVDAALIEMHRNEEALLYTNDNQRAITTADEAAALTLAGEPRHILWIEK